MSLHRHPRHHRLSLVLLAVLGMLGALALTQAPASAAGGSLPKPVAMTIAASSSDSVTSALEGAPAGAIPDVFAGPGMPFVLTVSLWADQAATIPAAFPKAQTVSFTATGSGVLGTQQGVIQANTSTTTFSQSYSAGAASVVVTAQIGQRRSALRAWTQSFRIEDAATLLNGQSAALKNGTAGVDGAGCAVVDAAHPMCGIVNLPLGATGTVGLSLGACPPDQSCASGGLVSQLIANLTDGHGNSLYTRTSPASMTIFCDKSICGQRGVTKFTALWSQSATGDLQPAPACPAKGVIGADQTSCTDYVSSTRDNAGDLHLVVLFLTDVRGSIK